MKHVCGLFLIIGGALLVGCATTQTPQDYGFHVVAMQGAQYYCAPRDWVVPPAVPAEAVNDPSFALYAPFLNLPYSDTASNPRRAGTREVCITPAQWPNWLTMRSLWGENWAVTPGAAESLAAERPDGGQFEYP